MGALSGQHHTQPNALGLCPPGRLASTLLIPAQTELSLLRVPRVTSPQSHVTPSSPTPSFTTVPTAVAPPAPSLAPGLPPAREVSSPLVPGAGFEPLQPHWATSQIQEGKGRRSVASVTEHAEPAGCSCCTQCGCAPGHSSVPKATARGPPCPAGRQHTPVHPKPLGSKGHSDHAPTQTPLPALFLPNSFPSCPARGRWHLVRGVSPRDSPECSQLSGASGTVQSRSPTLGAAIAPPTQQHKRGGGEGEGWEIKVFSTVRVTSNRHPPADCLIVIFWMSNQSKQKPLKCISAAAFLTEGVGFPLTSGKRELEQKTSSALELIK